MARYLDFGMDIARRVRSAELPAGVELPAIRHNADRYATTSSTIGRASGTRRARLDRFEPPYPNDKVLIWEYTSTGPAGEQLDVVESLDIVNRLIAKHRVYWRR
ncbi:hypothetical protein [Pseudonocardia spinosispora]|uniref:hypothetical protein n=1 Tax=Pseudonocardia spinosispora TaxID=103441 RepID=UPI0003F91C64|nr:hypothetical protein [Pseudonocardia spinosispora]